MSTLKDHEIATLVNNLRDVAVEFHGHQSLRERIAYLIRPLATHAGAAAEPVHVEAVATVVRRADGLALEWLIEGGVAALECEGVVLYAADRPLTDDEGSGDVYLAALTSAPAEPASSVCIDFKQATDLLAMFADEPNEITLTHYPKDDHHFEEGFTVSAGLYAHYADMPEEGSIYLGVSDQEAMPDSPAETPPAAGAIDARGQPINPRDGGENMERRHTPKELEEAVRAGWNACLRNLFSLADQTGDEATAREAGDFMRGRAFEAKGIARAMSGFGPEHCDDLIAYFAVATGDKPCQ